MSYLEPTQFAQSMIDTGEPKIKISILGSDFTLLDYFFWKELPAALGDLLGGFLLVGLRLYGKYSGASAEDKNIKTSELAVPR